ncbi:MAG: TrbC/VirB2 family protein [Proteobacteria bacterium]|nr:TrbC/VirB2 family protein [Pseudomonadota bacterium]
MILKKIKQKAIYAASALSLTTSNAIAGGSGMPWEGPLSMVLQSLEGPVASTAAVIAIIATGVGMAFGEGGSGMKKLFMVLFGISIAFGASTFFINFFGFSGGASL